MVAQVLRMSKEPDAIEVSNEDSIDNARNMVL
jgi:hypothetical protein